MHPNAARQRHHYIDCLTQLIQEYAVNLVIKSPVAIRKSGNEVHVHVTTFTCCIIELRGMWSSFHSSDDYNLVQFMWCVPERIIESDLLDRNMRTPQSIQEKINMP